MTDGSETLERGVIHTARGEVHYEAQGAGPVVFAIHGLPGSSRDFQRFGARVAARGVRVIAFDVPGFADTPALPFGDWHAIAADLAHACRELSPGPCVVAAHSFGAHHALRIAARMPEVRALALFAPAGLRAHRALRRLRPFSLLAAAGAGVLARPLFHRGLLHSGVARGVSRAASDLTLSLLASVDFGEIAAIVAALDIPVLAAYADDDSFVEPAVVDELTHALRHGMPRRFAEGGHAPHKMHGEELAAAVAALLHAT